MQKPCDSTYRSHLDPSVSRSHLPAQLLLLPLRVGLQVQPPEVHGLHGEAALGALPVAQEDLPGGAPAQLAAAAVAVEVQRRTRLAGLRGP